jgi:hypothetical protein
LVLALITSLLLALPVRAQESLAPPEQQLAELLELAEAYQSGYFEVVALCCYQLYASTGVIATDFANGYIGTEVALEALDENSLLHSACVTTLLQIDGLTPEGDTAARGEIRLLLSLLTAEGELLDAVRQTFIAPTEENAARAELARQQVARALTDYTEAGIAPETETPSQDAR